MFIAERHFLAHRHLTISNDHDVVALRPVYILIKNFLKAFRFSFRLHSMRVLKSLSRSKYSPLFHWRHTPMCAFLRHQKYASVQD